MLIEKGNLPKDALKGDIAIVTGAGRGIGYEAARALIWLGAKVAIAENNENDGKHAAENLAKEFGSDAAFFVKTDVGNDKDVDHLVKEVVKKWGKVDIVLNNATVFPLGPSQGHATGEMGPKLPRQPPRPTRHSQDATARHAQTQPRRHRSRLHFRHSPLHGSIRSLQNRPMRTRHHHRRRSRRLWSPRIHHRTRKFPNARSPRRRHARCQNDGQNPQRRAGDEQKLRNHSRGSRSRLRSSHRTGRKVRTATR